MIARYLRNLSGVRLRLAYPGFKCTETPDAGPPHQLGTWFGVASA